jgi:hypothetical protein
MDMLFIIISFLSVSNNLFAFPHSICKILCLHAYGEVLMIGGNNFLILLMGASDLTKDFCLV